MNNSTKFEDRASSSPSTHEGEPSESLCDRLSRTRDTSQRQLPTDQDYAVSTREYQTDQSSLKHASTAACPVLEKQQKQPQRQKQHHRFAAMDRVTPYQRFCAHLIFSYLMFQITRQPSVCAVLLPTSMLHAAQPLRSAGIRRARLDGSSQRIGGRCGLGRSMGEI